MKKAKKRNIAIQLIIIFYVYINYVILLTFAEVRYRDSPETTFM